MEQSQGDGLEKMCWPTAPRHSLNEIPPTHLNLHWGLLTGLVAASLVGKELILYQLDVEVMHASVMAAVVDATRIGDGAEVKEETSSWVHHG